MTEAEALAKAMGRMLKELRDEFQRDLAELREERKSPTEKLFEALLVRKAVDAQKSIDEFALSYLNERAHVTSGRPPSLVTRALS
jgi:Sec-independent protein translocase protein TatA